MFDRKGGCAYRIRGASTYKLLLPVFGKMSVRQEQPPFEGRIINWKQRIRIQKNYHSTPTRSKPLTARNKLFEEVWSRCNKTDFKMMVKIDKWPSIKM